MVLILLFMIVRVAIFNLDYNFIIELLLKEMDTEEEKFYVTPIANPMASDVLRNKILKMSRHLNREKNLKRGVKDVVKAIKKGVKGICIIAADVSPVDVISHIPVLC